MLVSLPASYIQHDVSKEEERNPFCPTAVAGYGIYSGMVVPEGMAVLASAHKHISECVVLSWLILY